jgi:orotate phosphoribosyltransferase
MSNLNEDCREVAFGFGSDFDIVVGVPKSGLLVANLFAIYLGIPITDVDGLVERRLINTGPRWSGGLEFEDIDRVLVVGDSVDTGSQMEETRSRVDSYDFDFDIEYAAIYVTPGGSRYVDHWADVVEQPRIFEWNIFHHPKLNNMCVDIDGVLCRDPEESENDDGEAYKEFINNVDTRIKPTEKIGYLVTCRLEKYREETESWLEKNDVDYGELIMMDHPDMETRRQAGDHSEYKSRVYRESNASLFIESSPNQSREIAQNTGRPVYCVETNSMVRPGMSNIIKPKIDNYGEYMTRFKNNPVAFSQTASKYMLNKIRKRI